ncbi:ARM repeat-containing protein [Backusella circina FSU 941]|nr:ARM repeat-containing protein [Backusella circina FSU 941]
MGSLKSQLTGELKDGIPHVLTTLSSYLFTDNSADLHQKAMKCLRSWIGYGLQLEDTYPLLQKIMQMLGDEVLFESAIEVLIDSIQSPKWARYNTFRNDILMCITSEGMKAKFTECINDEDDEVGKLLASLFTAFGEAHVEYISQQLPNPNIECLMRMLLQLTGFNGYFPVDQEVSEIPLNFWFELQETLIDNEVLPIKETIVGENGEWMQRCGHNALVIYSELVKILVRNSRFPDQPTYNMWNKECKDKFAIWRRDLGDTMISPYYILHNNMLSILLDRANEILNQWAYIPTALQDLEAVLFCLKSISEEINTTENQYICRFFGPEVLGRLPADCDSRLKSTVLRLMGSLSEWLHSHPEFLNSIMNYIVPCLSDPVLAPSASSAFSDICDTCRQELVGELDTLMNVYAAMSKSHIKSNIMQKVVESVADVIQVLPPENVMAPLMSLTGSILQGTSEALKSSDVESAREAVLVQLQYLSACCRGIQSPNDDYQSTEARMNLYDAYASGQLAMMYQSIEGFNEITFAIKESVNHIVHVWGDEDIVKALTHFLELGMKSTSPLLSLGFDDLTAVVQAGYKLNRLPSWLDTASVMMTVYGGQASHTERLRDLLGALSTITLDSINGTEVMENYPDVVDSYFGLVSRAIRRCPLAFYQLPSDMINAVFVFSISGMGLSERLAMKAALSFMSDFINQDLENAPQIAQIVDGLMMNMGLQIIELILSGIGGRVPRSFLAPLFDALYKVVTKYVQPSRQWLQVLLANDGFPSALATPKDKEAFVKGILGTRSVKKFKQAANVFAVKCRGLGSVPFEKSSIY